MKMTLLEMVQEILSSMDSDEVNSIDDTPEANQVALVIRRAYLDLAAKLNLPEHFDFFQLTASGDNDQPTIMYRPDDVDQLLWIKYDMRRGGSDPVSFKDVFYQDPSTFANRMFMHNSDEDNVDTATISVGGDDFTLLYRNDKHPSYWTSFNDSTLIFDSYLATIDTTLQKSKTYCYGLLGTSFTLSDAFTPDLDSQQFSLLLNDAKGLAWAELKQATHARAERESKRQLIRTQVNKRALPSGQLPNYRSNNLPNYGRK